MILALTISGRMQSVSDRRTQEAKFKSRKKVTNITFTIMQKPQAHLQTMINGSAKFQVGWYKTVAGRLTQDTHHGNAF